MYKGIEVIGIDHGWSYMKTISHVFVTGVEEIATEPAFTKNLMDGMSVYCIDNTLFLEKKKKIMWLIGQENQNCSII